MKVIDNDNAPGEASLCGVDAHAALLRERDELRAVIRDLVEGRGFSVTPEEHAGLAYACKVLKADGCHECAEERPDEGRSYAAYNHNHHPDDRAAAYRSVLGPGLEMNYRGVPVNGPRPAHVALIRILEVLVRT